MALAKYKQKRNFEATPEPAGKKSAKNKFRFVVQRHHASHLHYDFRLELDGVLKSWAVPKGPSMNPKDKRLAMMVEDHPVDYIDFEGEIPAGNYGAGTVIVWDHGYFIPVDEKSNEITEKQALAALKKGELKFLIKGKKIEGEFVLVKLKNDERSDNSWLLIKHRDEYAVDKKYNSEDLVSVTAKKAGEKKKEERLTKPNRVNIRFPSSAQKLTDYYHPMLATLVDKAFDDKEWIFEIKWDGYRAIADWNKKQLKFYSRNGLSFLEKFSPISDALQKMDHKVVIDGEVVLLTEEGKASFQKLQQYEENTDMPLVYYAFDLLSLDGKDLKDLPLIQRKELLQQLIEKNDDPVIKYSDHIFEHGKAFFNTAQQANLEGIIAKRADSHYALGVRSKEWLKIKYQLNREAIIAGYTEPRGSRKHFGALLLAQYNNDKLEYIGHTGTGFDQKALKELWDKMQPLVTSKSPFAEKIKVNMPVTWLKPKLVCQVNFSEETDEGRLRHPVYMGLRTDKSFKEVQKQTEEPVKKESVTKEKKAGSVKKNTATTKTALKATPQKIATKSPVSKTPAKKNNNSSSAQNSQIDAIKKGDQVVTIDKRKLTLTNPTKIYFPKDKITKGDLLQYYEAVAPYILPYLKDRPISLLRQPNGIMDKGFFHKDAGEQAPEWVKKANVHSESGDKIIHYIMCNDKPSLLYAANLGSIEMNPWNSTIKKMEYPTWMVIDIDPSDKNTFDEVVETALVTKSVLDQAGAIGFCKTSGATGLHVYIPMGARYTYDEVKEFAEIIAMLVQQQLPDTTSIIRSLSKRGPKIYVDFLQNRRGQTLAAPYSARPKPGATVSTPLEWDEVKKGLHPSQFTIKNILERIQEKGDLFSGVLGKGIDLKKCIQKLGALH